MDENTGHPRLWTKRHQVTYRAAAKETGGGSPLGLGLVLGSGSGSGLGVVVGLGEKRGLGLG